MDANQVAALNKFAKSAGQFAKSRGLGLAVEKGRYQFVRVTYDESGHSTVLPITDWMDREETQSIINENTDN